MDSGIKTCCQCYHDRTFKNVVARQFDSREYEKHEIERETVEGHLKWMCLEIMEGRVTGEKAHRWLGYIQGELRAMGRFTVMQLRHQSRECFDSGS